jgi:alkanesulfonate monooxygenase SsuD/methylene tetrahydromethanopterin reductase-like flavin-dependent oxidoreductase (luciferase family)
MYKTAIGITTGMKLSATNWIAQNADRLNVDTVWIGEDINVGQDVTVLITSTLLQTRKVRVGTGILPYPIYDIYRLARTCLSLHQMSGGRFILGTGVGGIQDLIRLGLKPTKPVTELRAVVDILHSLWNGKTITHHSQFIDLENADLKIKESVRIPIVLGVRGPQMLKLAGEVANGAILSGPFDYLRNAIELINKSAKDAGRKPEDIEKIVWLPTIPTFRGVKEKLAREVVSIVVADTPDSVLDMLDIDRELVDKIQQANREKGPAAGAEFVNAELIDMFAVSGNKQHMLDRFQTLHSIGTSEVVIGPPFSGKWREAIEDLTSNIR